MVINKFFHSTCKYNIISILEDKYLVAGKGIPIAGNNETLISISDYLNDYLAKIFGNIIREFNAHNIFMKNTIIPTVYSEAEGEDFEDMPFEECEWRADKISFDITDINKDLTNLINR
jgi:hypothetical protein